jgi:hypothetical protein
MTRIIKFNKDKFKQKILFLLRNNKEETAKKLIKKIAKKEFIEKEDIRGLYEFFSPIYDELFYDLIFEKLKLTNETKELLEKLSLPFFKMKKEFREEILKVLK